MYWYSVFAGVRQPGADPGHHQRYRDPSVGSTISVCTRHCRPPHTATTRRRCSWVWCGVSSLPLRWVWSTVGVNYLKVPPMITKRPTSTILEWCGQDTASWRGKINADFARVIYKKWTSVCAAHSGGAISGDAPPAHHSHSDGHQPAYRPQQNHCRPMASRPPASMKAYVLAAPVVTGPLLASRMRVGTPPVGPTTVWIPSPPP